LPFSNNAVMGLFNSRRQRFDNRFQTLENLLGLRTGPVRRLPVLIVFRAKLFRASEASLIRGKRRLLSG